MIKKPLKTDKNLRTNVTKTGVKSTPKKKDPLSEKVNGVSVYTAVYKVNRSDELLEFLLRKCNTSRNNVKSLLVRKQVLVNGKVVTQYNYVLAKDDEVKLARKPVKDGVIATQNTAKTLAEHQPNNQRKHQNKKHPQPQQRWRGVFLFTVKPYLL